VDQPIYPELEEMKKRCEDFIELVYSKKVTCEDIKSLLDYITESEENFFKCITVIDASSRTSDVFNIITKIHNRAVKNKQSAYYKKYFDITELESTCYKRFQEWDLKYRNKNRDWFKRPNEDKKITGWFSDFLDTCDIEYFKEPENENSKS
jgi:hypothetical protein